ncbi:M20 family metallopeptidase [Veillonella sp. VA142]|uniref:M20 metallopeptidase family protein n=1 Tax=Veillonella sp. VA142 TaxID=741834 RepID=UPI000F8F2B95|nr:M20 family metallopeptidase [Veillonella sp. VA142]
MNANINQLAKTFTKDMIGWRRHIHAHPELSGKEKETQKMIMGVLDALGIEHKDNVYGYAVIGTIHGGHEGPNIALRADMDALPIVETTGLPFVSQETGIMHACGHDSHVAILLGTASILQSIRDELHGTVTLVFQPAEEEALIAGAKGIMESGVLDTVDEIFGLHVWPQISVGKIGLKAGHFMAASDRFNVDIVGKATHGAEPHNGIDAIVAAANWITSVESIIARETNPMDQVVCTIGVFQAGERYNVGAGLAHLEGTCRTYDPNKRDYMEARLTKSLEALDSMFGTKSTIEYKRGHGATINSEASVAHAASVVADYLGEEAVQMMEHPSMAAEDFSAYLQHIPGTFIWLGTGFEGNPPLHNAGFTIDESILTSGATMMAGIVWERLCGASNMK